MFKLTYGELRDSAFMGAMGKLMNCPGYKDIKVSYNIMKTAKAIELKLKDSQREWLDIARPMIELGENGNFKTDASGFVFKEGVDKAEAEKKIQEFLKKEVLIDRFKMKLEDIEPARLTPTELAVLEPLLQHLEAVP